MQLFWTFVNLLIQFGTFFFYIVFINDLVDELDKSNLGVSICDIKAGNPALVDDLTLFFFFFFFFFKITT